MSFIDEGMNFKEIWVLSILTLKIKPKNGQESTNPVYCLLNASKKSVYHLKLVIQLYSYYTSSKNFKFISQLFIPNINY